MTGTPGRPRRDRRELRHLFASYGDVDTSPNGGAFLDLRAFTDARSFAEAAEAADPAAAEAADPAAVEAAAALAREAIRRRLSLMADGEPRDSTRYAAVWALELGGGRERWEDGRVLAAADDAADDAMRATGAEADALMREWAGAMGKCARLLLPAMFPDDLDPGDDLDPREWASRFIAWLVRQEGAGAEAAALRALLAQEELPAPRMVSQLLRALLRPEVILARLTWAWSVRGWWEARPRPKPLAMAMHAAQGVLALRGPTTPRRWELHGRELADLDTEAGPVRLDPFACATMPLGVAERLLSGDLHDLRSKAGLGVLDAVLRNLDAALRADPSLDPRHAAPRLLLPAGKALAAACRLSMKGEAAAAAEAALWAWSAVSLADHRGEMQRFILSPEHVFQNREARWRLVPGELLLPAYLAADAAQEGRAGRLPTKSRDWRRVMPWPDVRAPDDWARDCDRTDAGFVALGLVLDWTRAAGLDHGRQWQDAPGVLLNDHGWRRLVERAHGGAGVLNRRGAALDALGDAGWIEVDRDRVGPGVKLPELRKVLDAHAVGAARRRRWKPR